MAFVAGGKLVRERTILRPPTSLTTCELTSKYYNSVI